MSDRFSKSVADHLSRVVAGGGETGPDLRERAAANRELPAELADLVDKIHRHAYKVTDEEVAALRTRYSDDELFEVIVAAALGASRERLDAGLRALEEAK